MQSAHVKTAPVHVVPMRCAPVHRVPTRHFPMSAHRHLCHSHYHHDHHDAFLIRHRLKWYLCPFFFCQQVSCCYYQIVYSLFRFFLSRNGHPASDSINFSVTIRTMAGHFTHKTVGIGCRRPVDPVSGTAAFHVCCHVPDAKPGFACIGQPGLNWLKRLASCSTSATILL